jgi:hypothetical protein
VSVKTAGRANIHNLFNSLSSLPKFKKKLPFAKTFFANTKTGFSLFQWQVKVP